MKLTILIAALLAVTGCTTNGVYDPAKTWTLVGVVVVGGAVAAHNADTGQQGMDCHWVVRPGQSSTQVCR